MTRDEEGSSGPEEGPDAFEEARQALKHAEAELAKAREEQRRAEDDISEAETKLEEATRARYVFFVGKERFETPRHELTGAEIKAMVPDWHPDNPAGRAIAFAGATHAGQTRRSQIILLPLV